MPSEPDRLGGGARATLAAGTALLAGLAMWTYLPALWLWPWGQDAVRWAARADPATADWSTWVFFSRHFIGWRPVTALSFTLNALVDDSPVAMHLVDYGAMAATLLLVGGVAAEMYRSDRPAGGPRADRALVASALLAVALVALHPVLQEVVPYTARRSYDLASAFGLGGLALWLRELRQPEDRWMSGWIASASALLFLSFGSNEASFPIAALLPILAVHRRWPADFDALLRALRPTAAPLFAAAILATGRNFVLADDFSTGYVRKWFAYAEDGRNRIRLLESFEPGEVLSAAWTYVLFPSSGTGDPSLLWTGGPALAGAVVVLAWLAWAAVARPILRRADPLARRPLVLFAWAAGTATLYAIANTWFWREGFPLLLPLALTVGAIAHAALARPVASARDGARLAAWLAPAALLVVSVAWHSPVVRGWDMAPLAEELTATRILESVEDVLPDLPSYAMVWMVVPGDDDFAGDIAKAAHRLSGQPGQRFHALASVSRNDAIRSQHFVARVEATAAGPTLVLHPEAEWSRTAKSALKLTERRDLPLSLLARSGDRRTQLWWWDGPGFGALHRYTALGAELPPPRP